MNPPTEDTITKIPTWLPVFPGFYNTIFEAQFDQELEYLKEQGELPDSADEGDLLYGWDNGGYERAVVQSICDHMPRYFPPEAGILQCRFEKVVSPKEYNFVNDSANVTFEIDMAKFSPWVREYLKTWAKEWAKCIRKHYRSRDGFCSFYSDDVDDWNQAVECMLNGTEPPKEDRFYGRDIISERHLLGRLLDFILRNESEEYDMRMYYDISDHVYVSEFIDAEKVKERLKED